MNDKKSVTHDYFQLLDEPISSVTEEIWFSPTSPPPSTKDPTVHRLCEIVWNKIVPFESLPTWTNSIGKVYRILNYNIEMACEDGTVEFIVNYEGKRVGGHHVEVEFD